MSRGSPQRRPGMSRARVASGTSGIGATRRLQARHKLLASGHVATARPSSGLLTRIRRPSRLTTRMAIVLATPSTMGTRSATPPGDALPACYVITDGDSGSPPPLLAAVPPAFPVRRSPAHG